LAAFEQRAVADAAVQQCYRPSPGSDVVRVVRAADIPAYQALVQRAKLEPAIGLPAPPAR
jgi:Lrp/AsnC family leucine-responsive transcriptional regulator